MIPFLTALENSYKAWNRTLFDLERTFSSRVFHKNYIEHFVMKDALGGCVLFSFLFLSCFLVILIILIVFAMPAKKCP